MAWNIPKQLASLLVGDDTTQRAFANVNRALQPVLDFCNSSFTVAQDGTLSIVRKLVTQALTVNGTSVLNGSTTLNGNVFVKGATPNCLVVVPPDARAAFYVTNPANNVAQFLVNGDGTTYGTAAWSTTSSMTAGAFVSSSGFKSWISLGSYWNTNTASGDQYFTMAPIIRAGTATPAYIQRRWVPTRAGSIVGVSVWCNNTIAVSQNWTVQRNGTNIIGVLVPANTYQAVPTFGKGIATFSAGDAITCFVTVATGQNFAATVEIEIEEGA